MNIRAAILCSYLLLALPLFARESTDVIVMRNGDRFTGQVKALYGGVLYVGLPYVVQTLSVDWTKVAHLESKQLFIVKTEDGSVYNGALGSTETAAGRPIEIHVEEPPIAGTPEKEVKLNSAQIVDVSQTSTKFLQRFTGGVGVGSIYSKGNETVQYSISGLVAYPRDRWAAQAGLSSNLSAASGTSASTRNQLTFEGFHLLPKANYFYGGFDGFLQSAEQGISHQNTLGGGLGRYLKNTNRAVITVLGGLAWQNTDYSPEITPIATQNVTTAMIVTNVKLFTFNKTNLQLNAILLPALSEPGRLYASTNASYYIKITGNLSWNLSFYGNWDTQPPGHLPGSDYGSTSGLSWTFGSSLRTSPTTIQ
jgi:putative salt-induced outer membrane protein YdiY